MGQRALLEVVEQSKSIHWLSEVQFSVGFVCSGPNCRKYAVFMVHSGKSIPMYLCHSHGVEYARENQLDPGPRPNWIASRRL